MNFNDPAVQQALFEKIQKSHNDWMKAMDPAKSRPNVEKKFFSLGWTFSERFEMTTGMFSPTMLVCGSGPYVYSRREGHYLANSVFFDFGAHLCVFEATGTHVRGLQDLCNGYFVIWGDSYFAYVSLEQLIEGGTVCQRNIISVGRPIAAIRTFRTLEDSSIFEVYCADGTIQGVMSRNKGKRQSIAPMGTLRLPLKKGEMVTAAFTKAQNDYTYLGTSQGRLIAVKDLALVFITESLINSPVKQIAITNTQEGYSFTVLLLFENGSLVNFKDKKRFTELKGRYTRLSEFSFANFNDISDRNTLAGDMDGNLTAIRTGNWKLEIIRTMKNVTLNPISMIEMQDNNYLLIGTIMGEVQKFDMRLVKSEDNRIQLPASVRNSDYHCKANDGWYFLKDNKLFNCTKSDKKNKYKTMETYSNGTTNLKMKYAFFNGIYDREVVAVYGQGHLFAHISDYTYSYDLKINLIDCPTVIQVILMEQGILVQLVTGEVRIYYIDGVKNKSYLIYRDHATVDRIKAAVCIVRTDTDGIEVDVNVIPCINRVSFDLLIAHEHEKITVLPVLWNKDGSQKKLSSYKFSVELEGSHVVSMITSLFHCGGLQSLLLTKKGTLHLIYACHPKCFPPSVPEHNSPPPYSIVSTQILGPIIGTGHSLVDTSLGIFVAGFKQHTLHVCWISMSAEKPAQYCHVFSVDTASSRLPFTIIEGVSEKNGERTTTNEILVSYHQKTGIKEDRFTFYEPKGIQGFKHSGIITDCFVSKGYSATKHFYYSGDTDGRFCLWAQDDNSINGQSYVNEFKLNGAITTIHCIDPYIAVSTSQGAVHFFLMIYDIKLQLIPQFIYKAGQKVAFVTSSNSRNKTNPAFMVFLGDGTVKEYTVDTKKERAVCRFPASTKMGISLKHKRQHYIAALGVDGILRRTVLMHGDSAYQMSWKISFIKQLLTGPVYFLAVGDHEGRVCLVQWEQARHDPYFYSDRLHKHEIIDIANGHADNEAFIFSLDSSGLVVIRKIFQEYDESKSLPIIWACPVPSPRKIVVLDKRRIMVLGKGVATKTF